jgi:hypothetical protein
MIGRSFFRLARAMATLTVTDRHRGTVIARKGVLVSVRMTVPSYSIGLISLGDRASDDQPVRAMGHCYPTLWRFTWTLLGISWAAACV